VTSRWTASADAVNFPWQRCLLYSATGADMRPARGGAGGRAIERRHTSVPTFLRSSSPFRRGGGVDRANSPAPRRLMTRRDGRSSSYWRCRRIDATPAEARMTLRLPAEAPRPSAHDPALLRVLPANVAKPALDGLLRQVQHRAAGRDPGGVDGHVGAVRRLGLGASDRPRREDRVRPVSPDGISDDGGLDTVRKSENRALVAAGDKSLTGSKYLSAVLRGESTPQHADRFATLRSTDLKTAKAWAIRERLRQFWS
jgi:hypothetical protein